MNEQKESIIFQGNELRRFEPGCFIISNGLITTKIVYEPGDCTRYEFYAIDIGHAYLIASDLLDYPKVIEKYLLKKGKEAEAVQIIFNNLRANTSVNVYTIWAAVSALLKLKEFV